MLCVFIVIRPIGTEDQMIEVCTNFTIITEYFFFLFVSFIFLPLPTDYSSVSLTYYICIVAFLK